MPYTCCLQSEEEVTQLIIMVSKYEELTVLACI